MLTFEKRNTGGPRDCGSEFRVYIYRNTKKPNVQMIFRLSRSVFDKAGWFVGDYAIPGYDQDSRRWVLSRTADKSKGYMVTSTDKTTGGKAVYLKVTVAEDVAESAIPGGQCSCTVVSADSRSIVGQF